MGRTRIVDYVLPVGGIHNPRPTIHNPRSTIHNPRPTPKFRPLLLAVALVWLPLNAAAQEPAMQGTLPDSIVITASRLPEDVRLTGRRVTVLTAEDIQRAPASSFDELLRAVGGVEMFSRGGFGVQSDFTMRGSSFNGVLVLLDGARLNDPMTGHFLANLPIPLSEIARIEVVRGPAGVLYGPDAIGGVIHVFTYAGLREVVDSSRAIEGTAFLQTGEHALYHLDANGYYVFRRTALSAATAWQNTEGAPIQRRDGSAVFGSRGPLATDFDRQALTAAVVQGFSNMKLYLRGGVDDRTFGAYHYYTPFATDTARETTSTSWGQVQLRSQHAASTPWSIQFVGRRLTDNYEYNPQTLANRHTSTNLMLQAQISQQMRPDLLFTAGVLGSLRRIDSNNLGEHRDYSTGVFGLARWHATERATVSTGLRMDVDPGYGMEATPQLNFAYNLTRATLRAGVSRAVRAPTFVEQYYNTAVARPSGNLGNPDLKAERAWAYEAGIDLYPAPGIAFHGTVFDRHTNNLIDFIMLSPQDTIFLARNLLDVRTLGAELDAQLRAELVGMPVTVEATYTWLDARLANPGEGVQYKYVLGNARHLVQVASSLQLDPLLLTVRGLWKEPQVAGPFTEAYGVVDLRLAYVWNSGRFRLSLSGEVRNLFDQSYSEVFDAPMPRRWMLEGIKVMRR